MATIRKVYGKNGLSYKITVTTGRDSNGKQIRHYKTYTPKPNEKESKSEKEAARLAVTFEEELRNGYRLDNRLRFSEYATYFLEVKKAAGLKRSTIERYQSLLPRINAGIGDMKLTDIRPTHLNLFYQNLMEEGIRDQPETAVARIDLNDRMSQLGLSQEEVSRRAQISSSTTSNARNYRAIRRSCAEKIAVVLEAPYEELFQTMQRTEPLATKTVLEHHRLIRTILGMAEKEMLVHYNAASKATPPKAKRAKVDSYQPEEITRILEALGNEPLKWQAIVHLMIITGCRRGEIMVLKWTQVDWEHNVISIQEARLASDSGTYEDTPKTSESQRYINIPKETVQLLEIYRQEQERTRSVVGDRWVETGYVFTQDTGKPMHPDSVNGWLNKFSRKYNLPHIHPHAFRHSMASILINCNTDILTISKRLGHSMTSTTLNFYGHLIQKADAQSSECIADVLLRKKSDDN